MSKVIRIGLITDWDEMSNFRMLVNFLKDGRNVNEKMGFCALKLCAFNLS